MKVVGYSSWAPDERANAMRLAFHRLREVTKQEWTLHHFGASDFNDPTAIHRLRQAIREADILVGWQSMTHDTVDRLGVLITEMEAAGELGHVKILWYDIPDPRLQGAMFKSLGFEFDMNKSNPMRELSMHLKRSKARKNDETIDEFWEAREGFLGMQKMVGAAPMMAAIMKKPVFKSLVMIGYWNNRSVRNIENMFLYLMKHFMGSYNGNVPLPDKVENEGIYHHAHDGLFQTPEAYFAWYHPWFEKTYGKKPWEHVGFITHDLFLPEWNHPTLDGAIKAWEARGLGVITSMTAVFNAHLVSRKHLLSTKEQKPLVGAVYHNVPLYLAGSMFAGAPEPSIELIHELGNPRVYTSPVNAAMSRADLAASKFGVASLEYIGNVVTPETEGIQPMPPICSREHTNADVSALEPIPDRIALLADTTTAWLKLRAMPNAEKKVAFFIYNFPPGPGNVGVALFLDVAASTREMLIALRDQGYTVGDVDETDAEMSLKLQDVYAGYRTIGAVSAAEIRDWVADLPTSKQGLFYDTWGQPPATIPVKGLRFGNVLVLLQDMKGMEDLTVIHDKQAPPSPWLLASYRYATRRFGADAMVHIGTHGLVEWSAGKEWCPAAGDYPEFLIDETPHAYVFNVVDPVEASIARRRSYATILSHLSPALVAVEGGDDLRNLHRLVHDYYTTAAHDAERRADTAAEIVALVERSGLRIAGAGSSSLPSPTNDDETVAYIGAVHDELVSVEGEYAPAGQHVFGRNLSEDDRLSTFYACLEFCDIDLYRLIGQCYGIDYDAIARTPEDRAADGTYHHDILDAVRDAGREVIANEVIRPTGASGRAAIVGLLKARPIANYTLANDPYELVQLVSFIERAKTMWTELGRVGDAERSGFVQALSGSYVEPSMGGELIGDWSVLPTGRNMASVDVRMLPKESAQRKARRTVEMILEGAIAERGHYPQTVGVVLWGSEVLESEGVGIAQALDLMGVRVAKDRFNRAERPELISLDELGRPRVDILANASTVFKNTFPGAVRIIQEAAILAATADEPHEWNFVKKHSDELLARGVEPKLAYSRVFGMPEDAFMGQVGAMLDRGTFESYEDIGAAWMSDNGNAYLPEYAQIRVVPAHDVQKYLVTTVEVIQQPLVQMAAGGPVKEDMFASFTSAFGAAKRAMGHEDTMIVVSDLTRREPKVRNFRNLVVNGVLTRFHSEAWRDRMMKHGYSGVMEFGDIFKAMRSTEAALGNTISPDLWKRTVEVTISEWDRISEANSHKTRELGEILLDTQRRGMWEDADLEQQIKDKLNELDADVELATYRKQQSLATTV
jgi:cobalamin biosynthesis Mg chelatase CobN